MDTLSTIVVEEGAPVVDDDGDLVGLCTTDADSVQVLTVSTMPGTSTTTTTTAPLVDDDHAGDEHPGNDGADDESTDQRDAIDGPGDHRRADGDDGGAELVVDGHDRRRRRHTRIELTAATVAATVSTPIAPSDSSWRRFGRDHRPPLLLGALDVRLLVGDRRGASRRP